LSGLQTGCWLATRATVAVREKSAGGWRSTRAPSMGGEFSRSRRPRQDELARGSETRPYPSPNRHSARRAQRSTKVCANAPKNRRHARAFAPRGLPLRAPARARPSRRWRLTDARTFGCCSRAGCPCWPARGPEVGCRAVDWKRSAARSDGLGAARRSRSSARDGGARGPRGRRSAQNRSRAKPAGRHGPRAMAPGGAKCALLAAEVRFSNRS